MRTVLVAVALLVAYEIVANAATLILDAATTLDGKARDLVSEAILAVVVIAIVAAVGWWRSTGISTHPAEWRHLRLLVIPLLLTLVPFAGGVKGSVDGGTIAILVVGYALNSVAEDGMFRGILPRVLRGDGLLVAVVLSSLLFGLAHFGDIVSRPEQSVAITAAQALGAFTQGIGLVALRLANRSIWPAATVHFLADLFGQIGGLPIVLANVIESVAMLAYGIWIYRTYRPDLQDELHARDREEVTAGTSVS